MEKIKLGSLCLTKNEKHFHSTDGDFVIKKGTFVSICDVDDIKKGYVLAETEGCPIVLDYDLDELVLIK